MGIGLPLSKLLKAELSSGLEKLKSGAKKLKNQIKLTSKKGFEKNPLFYFGVFLAIFTVILTFTREQNNNLLLSAISESQDQKVAPSAFLEAKAGLLRQTPDLLLIGESGVLSAAPPVVVSPQTLGALFLANDAQDQKRVVTEYVVEAGDTLVSLAEKFNVSVDTLLWANNLSKNSVLKVGQKLVILPVSGVIHHVKDKDTLSGIAETYKARVEDIIAFNELSEQGQIYIGDIIVVPNGVQPPPTVKLQTPALQPLGDSYFMCPTGSCAISQGLHWYNAIDFNGNCGEQVRAAAAGQVVKVALTTSTSRYAFGGAGNHITILHPNGVTTLYGHLAVSLVGQGDQVSQGQPIALMGGRPGTPGAGMSTGCHVHFGVTGARNPFAR